MVGFPHDIKGQGICAYATLTLEYSDRIPTDDPNSDEHKKLVKDLRNAVRSAIGPFATPDIIIPTPALPMTRSGKIMRRILRKIASNELDTLGDISTLAEPSVVDILIEQMKTVRES